MKVWVVTELYYPEETSTGHYLTGIAEGLARDFEAGAICSQPTYSKAGTRAPRSETRNGVQILRAWTPSFDRRSLLRRLLSAALITTSLFFRTIRAIRRGDVLLVVTNPPMLPFVVSLAARIRGARCVLLVHDVYPDVLVATGLTRGGSVLFRVVAAANRRLFRRMKTIIALGEDMKRLLESRAPGVPVVVIPNWGDTGSIVPLPRRSDDEFVIQYSGNMGRTHDLALLVAAAERLRDRPQFRFVLIGSGAKRDWVLQTVNERALTNVVLPAPAPRADLNEQLAACDVATIAFVPGMAGISVPSRMYNVLASGRPMIVAADRDSELATVVREERVGIAVEPGDVDGFVRAVETLAADRALREEFAARARQLVLERYTYEIVRDQYVKLMHSVITS
jgi:colanic acid biosynthesis glycosyl transferase WcaI